MNKLDEIKSIFYKEGYTISNNRGLDEKGLGQWVDDTDWLIKRVEMLEKLQEKTAKNLTKCRCKLADIKIILNT